MNGQTTDGPVSGSAVSLFATRVQFGLGAVLHTPSLRAAGFEDDDENEAPGEATARRVPPPLRYGATGSASATARPVFLDRISIFGKAYTFRMDKDTKNVVCGAGGFLGGHLVADQLRQGCTNIRALDLKPVARRPIAGSTTK